MSLNDIEDNDKKENIMKFEDEKNKENKNNNTNNKEIFIINAKSNQFNENKSNISKSDENNNSKILNSSINDNPIRTQLIEFGYNKIYSKRIIQYFHPNNIEEALDYFSENQGIIQHRFIKDRNANNSICYICGEKKEIHLDYIPDKNPKIIKSIGFKKNINYNNNSNNNEIIIRFNDFDDNNKKNIQKKKIKVTNEDLDLTNQNICEICSEMFVYKKENTVPKCGHSFCNSCLYDFLSVQIQENKLSAIKCLDYYCKEKISDKFIINLLNNDNELIKKI